ncbi:TetR/AcrR family transcriptional regulator [Actinomadura madurae]|uniref:TetR/AcrR family transcriptional regulator n=1 Tax=Actinomadura madurae TaxID=1993 RepID=UPI0020D2210F|nr:TetR family transcriptional regulator [Actinomadura madurae]MCP9953915.1 TetR family transcriptional regulator [Actinomadura madurae]MCP9970664.1 TetR family transcriptional regulator [Actinomadura madurae]MCP9983133.1 TetR family transcriptional regulator [Actinomadura madurae]MCQ0005306.1 TetR family transcriptional regulator [Actinomadura madurae]MCQ0019381.1 TetR family transcriptional regulator [Actinomadura madurae]
MAPSERAEDLTGRARIRDAALAEFAEHGVKGATIRGIAKAAGVSPALVQHHYGTKEALREACDAHVIEVIRETKSEALCGGMANPNFLSIAMRTALPVQRYVARALTDGSAAAAALFDDAVEYSEEVLERGAPGITKPQTDDVHGYATVMTGMSLGLIVLHEHMSRALGADTLTRDGYPRMALAMLDVLTDSLISPELAAQTRAALKALPAAGGQSPHEENR